VGRDLPEVLRRIRDCATTAAVLALCPLEVDALVRCAETAPFTCNASGFAQPVGCDAESAAFSQCLGA
jgi:hypothetical protein